MGWVAVTHPLCPLSLQQCRPRAALRASRRCAAARATQATGAPADVGSSGGATSLLAWLKANGLPEGQKVRVATTSKDLDYTVASEDIAAGDVVLRVPENLVVTLASVFEDGTVAELLTTNKLSELACLTLYLSYEKKRGEESFWHPFIKELDHQRGRGPQGARSPLLWQAGQAEELLAGSPVLAQIQERLKVRSGRGGEGERSGGLCHRWKALLHKPGPERERGHGRTGWTGQVGGS